MMKTVLSSLLLSAGIASAAAQNGTQSNIPPAWAADAIWYQIFVERFSNGDTRNDPTPKDMEGTFKVPPGWKTSRWTSNWYQRETWAANLPGNFNEVPSLRHYGGDLQGVLNKLDYLRDLGVTAIYLNPINDAPSTHKYDARYYHHVDVNFGPDPEGDKKRIAAENPNDPKTWVWTAADKLFLKLIEAVHKRNMRIIMDYSWNHTGIEFWAWKDLVKNQQASAYRDWYEVTRFDDPATPAKEFSYKGWANVSTLPEIRKVQVVPPRISGRPYEGNINEGAKQHIYAVSSRWLAPDGDPSKGVDGYRLDVADQIPMGFWRDYRKFVRSVKPGTYLVGEIWWEAWPDQLMNPAPYANGDIFDAVMFYQAYRPARTFFANTGANMTARQLADSLSNEWNRLGEPFRFAMMNVATTHDSPRLLSCFYNPGKYKYHANPVENPAYKSGKPDTDTYRRVRLYLLHQFTNIGAPHIWNGDEMGMWGGDDPDCRKPLWWKNMRFDPEYRNNFQPGKKTYDPVGFNQTHFNFYRKLTRLRSQHTALRHGRIEFLPAGDRLLAYTRDDGKEKILVLLNADPTAKTFSMPTRETYKDLMNNTLVKKTTISVPPLGGFVLKKQG